MGGLFFSIIMTICIIELKIIRFKLVDKLGFYEGRIRKDFHIYFPAETYYAGNRELLN